MKKIIKIRETIEKEIEIEFPFITLDKEMQRYYFNYANDKCIYFSSSTNSIIHSSLSNEGLEFEPIRKEDFFKVFDESMQIILDLLNK